MYACKQMGENPLFPTEALKKKKQEGKKLSQLPHTQISLHVVTNPVCHRNASLPPLVVHTLQKSKSNAHVQCSPMVI